MTSTPDYIEGEFLRLKHEPASFFPFNRPDDTPSYIWTRFIGWFSDSAVVEDANGNRSVVDADRLSSVESPVPSE